MIVLCSADLNYTEEKNKKSLKLKTTLPQIGLILGKLMLAELAKNFSKLNMVQGFCKN